MIPPDKGKLYEHHLECCPACQQRLDQAEECRDELRRLGREVGDPTLVPVDATLTQVLEKLQGQGAAGRSASSEPPDLYFLGPSDQPGVLGTLGAYQVQEVIGQGGMGVVLKAYEPALHRLVAIKVLAAAVAGSAVARRRFTREAQAAAAVCHDNIVAVHGVHELDGLPYLVMQYVSGESLQARLDRSGPLEPSEVVRIGLQTASALAAAHAQGLTHRDVKPANLLLENGLARVKITDFGLARMADDAQLTRIGEVAGTPEYMAPEQARGEPVDHRCDLFSLGSVLYAMCTGRPPFRGATALAVLHDVNERAPAPIRSLNPDVPAWLEALVARLMAKDPDDRFQSAAEVAALLEGYLAHLRQPEVPAPRLPPTPLLPQAEASRPRLRASLPARLRACFLVAALALPGSLMALTALFLLEPPADSQGVAARPGKVGPTASRAWLGAAAVVLLVIGLSAGGVWYAVRRPRRRGEAPSRAADEDEAVKPSPPTGSVAVRCPGCGKDLKAKAEHAGKKVKCPRCGAGVLVPAIQEGAPPSPATREPGTGPRPRARLWAGSLALVLVALLGAWGLWPRAPKQRLSFVNVTVGQEAVAGVEETGFHFQEYDVGQPFRWTNGNGRLVIPIDRAKPPGSLVVQLAVHRGPGVRHAQLQVVVNRRPLFSAAISPGSWEKVFDLSGIDLGEQVVVELISDTFSPLGHKRNDRRGQSDDGRALGVQVRGIKLLGDEQGPPDDPPRAVAARAQLGQVHPGIVAFGGLPSHGKTLVSGSLDGTVAIWEVGANEARQVLHAFVPHLRALAVSPDGDTFATAAGDRLVRVWDTGTAKPRRAFPGHRGRVLSLAYSPDGKTLASAGDDNLGGGELKLWDLAGGKERVPVEPFPFRLWGLAYAPDGKRVAVIGGEATAQVLDTSTGKELASVSLPLCGRGVAFSPDGSRLAVAYGQDGWVRLHEVGGGEPGPDFQVPGGKRIFGLAFAGDGKRLLTACGAGATILWDVSGPRPRAEARLGGHEGAVRWALPFPDGRTAVTGGEDGTVRLWGLGRAE
jgi:serine/threonine protein kinase